MKEALKLVLEQALEALNWSTPHKGAVITHGEAITAIYEALAQPAQKDCGCAECGKKEKDGWYLYCVDCMDKTALAQPPQRAWVDLDPEDRLCAKHMLDEPEGIEVVIDYKLLFNKLAEKFALLREETKMWKKQALFRFDAAAPTQPPQRTWVGLTEEEIDYLYVEHRGDGGPTAICEQFAKAIEAKLKEKNNG